MTDQFKEKAKEWDNDPAKFQMANKFLEEFNKHFIVNKDHVLLEFGCGTGMVGLQLTEQAKAITMVDTSPAMLARLREKIDNNTINNITVHEGEIFDIASKDHYDLVFSLMAFHHVHDIPGTLQKFHSLLNSNGQLIIGDLVNEDGSFHKDADVPHHGFASDSFNAELENNGFRVKKNYVYNTITRETSDGEERSYEQFIVIAEVVK